MNDSATTRRPRLTFEQAARTGRCRICKAEDGEPCRMDSAFPSVQRSQAAAHVARVRDAQQNHRAI